MSVRAPAHTVVRSTGAMVISRPSSIRASWRRSSTRRPMRLASDSMRPMTSLVRSAGTPPMW